jgi:hypothetical protein
MIPRWILDKRLKTCLACEQQATCTARFEILAEAPRCPLGRLASRADEVAAKAWPESAQQVSGCCDSAVNYLSRMA